MSVWTKFSLITSPLIIIGTFFWIGYVRKCYDGYAQIIDQQFSSCTMNNSINKTLVLIPYDNKTMPMLLGQLKNWIKSIGYPFKNESELEFVEFVFLRIGEAKDIGKEIGLNNVSSSNSILSISRLENFTQNRIKQQFNLDYTSLNSMTQEESESFYYAIENFNMYSYIFFMHPNLYPIKNGWLTDIITEINDSESDIWFYGAQQRNISHVGGRLHGYMNSNMVVKIGNTCVKNITSNVRRKYRNLPFNTSFMRYMLTAGRQRVAQHVIPHIRFTDKIINVNRSPNKLNDIGKISQNAILVQCTIPND